MADLKGFRRGFLLGATKKPKKKVSRTVNKVSSALLDLESPRHSIFAVEGHVPNTQSFITEEETHPPKEGPPRFSAIKTNRKPQTTVCTGRSDDGEGNVTDDTTNIFLNPSVLKEEIKSQSPVARPRWLLAEDDSSQTEESSQMTNDDCLDAHKEQGNVDIAQQFADTLLRMRRCADWQTIGSDFAQSHLQTISKRNMAWGLILDGDLTIAKLRLALCLSQLGIDPLIRALRDTGTKKGRYRTMRCLAIIEYRLDKEGLSSDLVDSLLPELGRIVTSEKGRTRLTQQAVEVAITLVFSASLVGLRDFNMAKLLHRKMSTVDQLLETQKAWLGNDTKWFTVEGARFWCKNAIIEHWLNVNRTYRENGMETSWCRELQGLDKLNTSFASTLLPSSEFSIDALIAFLKLSLERNNFSCGAGLTGFLAWLSRKGTRIQSKQRDEYDCVEKLLLDLLARQTSLVPLLAALNAMWSDDGFVPRDVLRTIPCTSLPTSLERLTALLTSSTNNKPDHDLVQKFARNILFHSSNLIGANLLDVVDIEGGSDTI